MKITDKDLKFIQSRQQINKYAYIILGIIAALFIAVVLYFVIKTPELMNPYAISEKLEAGVNEKTTVSIIESFMSIFTLSLVFVSSILILFIFLFLRVERKLLAIISSLKEKTDHT